MSFFFTIQACFTNKLKINYRIVSQIDRHKDGWMNSLMEISSWPFEQLCWITKMDEYLTGRGSSSHCHKNIDVFTVNCRFLHSRWVKKKLGHAMFQLTLAGWCESLLFSCEQLTSRQLIVGTEHFKGDPSCEVKAVISAWDEGLWSRLTFYDGGFRWMK